MHAQYARSIHPIPARAPKRGLSRAPRSAMQHTDSLSRSAAAVRCDVTRHQDTVDTYLWRAEYDFLHSLYDSTANVSPKFRFPDLISACVSLVFEHEDAAERLFDYLRSKLVLRGPAVRRREAMWRQQYELLLGLQRSPANRHPYPQFQLDQFTTACVALASRDGDASRIFERARRNTAARAARR